MNNKRIVNNYNLSKLCREKKYNIIEKIVKNSYMYSPNFLLRHASSIGSSEVLDILLKYHDIQDLDGNSALLYAIENEYYEVVKKLLKLKVDPNKYSPEVQYYKSALGCAVKKDNYKIVKIILFYGAKPDFCFFDWDDTYTNVLEIILLYSNYEFTEPYYSNYSSTSGPSFDLALDIINDAKLEQLNIDPILLF
jgi:ankyrin repeat protein